MKAKDVLISLLFAAIASGTEMVAQGPDQARSPQAEDPLVWKPLQLTNPYKPIVNAPLIAPGEVTDQVLPEELVLGFVIGGQARAYPLNMLSGPTREIINDTVGGRSIAATF